jgi:hypothetical protein
VKLDRAEFHNLLQRALKEFFTDYPDALTYRGQMLEIEIRQENVEYTLREGESLVIRHETEEIRLTRENPVAVRPVSTALPGKSAAS